MSQLLPLFLNLEGRRVLVVGGGPVAASKLGQLLAVGADVHLVSPEICADIAGRRDAIGLVIERRGFEVADLDGVWLVVAAATPDVNRRVAEAAEGCRVFVNAVDDPANASAFLSGVVRRDGVTLAISTEGAAPGLTALLRQALDRVLPEDLAAWVDIACGQRGEWRRTGVPMAQRRPLLLQALNRLYRTTTESTEQTEKNDLCPKARCARRTPRYASRPRPGIGWPRRQPNGSPSRSRIRQARPPPSAPNFPSEVAIPLHARRTRRPRWWVASHPATSRSWERDPAILGCSHGARSPGCARRIWCCTTR